MADACTGGIDTGFIALGYGKVAVLGVVQGLTELLPVSSTAHMRIVPALLGWQDPGSAFSAAMQLAALAAVVSYFWADIRSVASGAMSAIQRRDFRAWDLRFVVWIGLATIPGVLGGALLKSRLNTCGSSLRSLEVIGIACLVMGLLLAIAELYCRHRRVLADMTLLDAMIVGIAQVGALIPGVSRSGSSLTAALFLDLRREEAARFSFLLGLPFIALAGAFELLQLFKAHLGAQGWSILAVGLVVGAVSAFAAIWSLMRILERFSAWPFVLYRIVLGVLLLVGAKAGWLS
ncbi:undecaprenyl-diphosphatase UppP [Lichenihabitans sp. Uapishka_5]|uniref:undecaprenyl-diphosphatase UppP n=1 Tax=Lichenihabitans sp. Uapishka_5 TaxID=3037302 RepID=UPI0029E7D956|nr:undecaprenyl-diphosphatase UppP [Lichenihabitans sp. Uapishka_5]MDX7950005.1 undecaprenyl-diphosphatase UppP [Lichenihabitans sp. Uapishka_5]